jgi:hypothetical protein
MLELDGTYAEPADPDPIKSVSIRSLFIDVETEQAIIVYNRVRASGTVEDEKTIDLRKPEFGKFVTDVMKTTPRKRAIASLAAMGRLENVTSVI